MNDTVSPDRSEVDRAGDPTYERGERPTGLDRPGVLFALVAFLSVVVGLVTGIGVGSLAAEATSCGPSDQWCGLSRALTGAFFGGIAGIVAYSVVGIVVIRMARAPGHRAGPIAFLLAGPWLLLATLATFGAFI